MAIASPQQPPFPLPLKIAAPLAFACGFFYFLAFPGIDLYPLAFVALTPLAIALRGQTPRRGFFLGWLAGFTMTMLGFYWLLEMLRVFSGFPTPLCILFMALLCAYQAGRIAVWGWLVARASEKGWNFYLLFGLGFAATELTFPLLFPWYFGATIHPLVLLTQVAELGGPILVGLVLLAANLVTAELVIAKLEHRPYSRRCCGILASPIILAILYGSLRIPMVDQTVAKAPKVRVGLVQANMSLLGKRNNKAEGLRRHLRLTQHLEESGVDLVVWSETSVMRAVEETAAAKVVPQVVGRHLKTDAIIGAVLYRPVSDARRFALFNSALSLDEKGQVTGRYDKRFLLAFGEYLPLGETFPILYEWSPNSGQFSPGRSMSPLPVLDHFVATIICYEDLSPSFVNSMFRFGPAQLLVNMTNDAWFGDSIEPFTHFALAKYRAIEQRRFFVRSTNSGVSGFIDPVGRTISQTPTFTETAQKQTVAWLDGTTVYRMIGDLPWWLATLASVYFAFSRRKGTLPPGQANPAPGQANAAPGQANAAPGQINAAPGQSKPKPSEAT